MLIIYTATVRQCDRKGKHVPVLGRQSFLASRQGSQLVGRYVWRPHFSRLTTFQTKQSTCNLPNPCSFLREYFQFQFFFNSFSPINFAGSYHFDRPSIQRTSSCHWPGRAEMKEKSTWISEFTCWPAAGGQKVLPKRNGRSIRWDNDRGFGPRWWKTRSFPAPIRLGLRIHLSAYTSRPHATLLQPTM